MEKYTLKKHSGGSLPKKHSATSSRRTSTSTSFSQSSACSEKLSINNFEEYLLNALCEFQSAYGSDVLSSSAELEDFYILRTIGVGSFSTVYLAKAKYTHRNVALKVISKERVISMKAIHYVLNEKRILESIHFPFCIFLEHSFHDADNVYLAMPFINGGDLSYHLKVQSKFSERTSSFYAAQVVLCFEYLHYLGLVYRDLKPENILLDAIGYIRLTDFNFCKRINRRTYTFCGTPEYLAPEIIQNQGYGPSVDWWALGILIFEMSAGYPPFRSSDPWKLYSDITSAKYSAPDHFSKELNSLVGGFLQKDSSQRYGSLRNGVHDIKSHVWFQEIDWISLINKAEEPPIVPDLKGPDDASYFEDFQDESPGIRKSRNRNHCEHLFDNF